ncbi:hypothetical protein PVAND_013592 [Polypedilum vanderplanki]|uniref:Cytochrome P450 n=1 Tax=Polypedilum vanderplanki TaxID=319348 RepID=A0A9J6CQS5_POLVA|nr:hypothetical protein PVAND_013592 [Polypedilum vanderplanki]
MSLNIFDVVNKIKSKVYKQITRWKRRRLHELANKIPGFRGLPFIGEIHKFSNLQLMDYTKKLMSYCENDNKITKAWFGPLLVILTENADCIHTILNSSHSLHKPSLFYNAFYMDRGLLAGNGEEYDRHRKILNKSFTVKLVQKLVPTFNEKSKTCVEKLKKNLNCDEFDAFEYVGTCTLESFSTGQLNYHEDLYDSNFMKYIDLTRPLIMKRMFSPWYNFKPLYKLSSLCKKLDEYFKILMENIENIKKSHFESSEGIHKDIVINLLMDKNNNFSEEELKDELITFIFAGHEATAISLSSAVLMLAIHQDVQKRVIDEINEIVGSTEEIDYELLSNLPYMEMVIKESLRLFPAGGILGRQTTDEMEIGGYKVPKGTALILSIFGMQRSAKYWGYDAHLFRPERFESENLKNVHPFAFEPFSGGKRVCIGIKYAMAFMKTFLINFLRAYKISSTLKFEDLTLDMVPTLIISQKYMIKIENRT